MSRLWKRDVKKSSPKRLDSDSWSRSGNDARAHRATLGNDAPLAAHPLNPGADPRGPVAYEFGPFRLEPTESRLLRQGVSVALSPKTLETLVVLVAHAGHLVDKGTLLRQVWADTIVEEGSLAQHIYLVRKALSDEGGDARYVETVPKRGYRFTAAVRVVDAGAPPRDAQDMAWLEPGPSSPSPVRVDLQREAARLDRPEDPAPETKQMTGARVRAWPWPQRSLRLVLSVAALVAGATLVLSIRWHRDASTPVVDLRVVSPGGPAAVAAPPVPKIESSAPLSEAQAAYLRGREHWSRRTEAGLRHALRYFELALRHDPRHAPALAGLADTYGVAGALRYGPLTATQAFTRAETYAARALAVDPDLAEAHAALALVKQYRDRDAEAAKSEYRRALQLDPESALALQRYAMLLVDEGRLDDATEAFERAARLDPVSPSLQANLCYTLYLAQKGRRALPYCDRALEVEPDLVQPLTVRGLILMQEARWQEAIRVLQRARAQARGTVVAEVLEALGQAYAAIGRPDQTQALLSELRHLPGGDGDERVHLAGLHMALGQVEEAWNCLHFETARVPLALRLDPRYAALRRDGRFRQFARPGDPGPALAATSSGQPAVLGGGDLGVRTVAPEGPVALDR
jgi:DNA-binding winged helix-turn-helix (wHTH) protein/tetratricopeptide (TPR) repeat protein